MTAADVPRPTPETILAHELIGLDVRVADAPNDDLVGIAGTVVDETMRTLRLEADDGRVRTVPKAGTSFEFALPATDADDDGSAADATRVVVDGGRLVARPARRTKDATGGSTWHSA